jgi:hypothetical protein
LHESRGMCRAATRRILHVIGRGIGMTCTPQGLAYIAAGYALMASYMLGLGDASRVLLSSCAAVVAASSALAARSSSSSDAGEAFLKGISLGDFFPGLVGLMDAFDTCALSTSSCKPF